MNWSVFLKIIEVTKLVINYRITFFWVSREWMQF